MKHALYDSEQALKDYSESSWHERLNIMTKYFEQTLPIVVEEMKRNLEEEQNGKHSN